jgi:hypothetical protein
MTRTEVLVAIVLLALILFIIVISVRSGWTV